MTSLVSVALPLPIRRAFVYRVPEGTPAPLAGMRVRVPFGERAMTGVVTGEAEAPPDGALRELLEVMDEEPVCTPELLETSEKVARRFFASQGEVLKSALPARLPALGSVRYRLTEKGALSRPSEEGARGILERLSGGEAVSVGELPGRGAEKRDILRRLEERGFVRPISGRSERRPRLEHAYTPARVDPDERDRALGRSRKGREVLRLLEEIGRPATAAEIRSRTGAGPAVLRSLAASGLLLTFEQAPAAEAGPAPAAVFPRHRLSAGQEAALATLVPAIREKRFLAALLFGVTGSGKTEVYLRAMESALEAGRGAIWLVPEIALTPVFARRLRRQFGGLATVFHSGLSERERAEAWERLRDGRSRIVIGPRSAAFAPMPDPGLFVVDEEHDTSYKQRESPRYDARDVVALRARASGAAVVYGSATPSIEIQEAARRGRVERLVLPERIDARPLPQVSIVDLRHEPWIDEEKGIPLFSRPLLSRLTEVFARGEQAILLQPRRGFAPVLLCRSCGHDFRCPRCSVARSVHQRGRVLLCHYCGQRDPRPARCPECAGALLEAVGAGTERVAERFAGLFPEIPCAVLDRDTARRRGIDAIIDDVLEGRVRCLIGTQMVAKGHDFPGVTAVGVLSADTILNFPDFRSAEKTFQLLAQVAGRAGRGDTPGTVHVQTFHPQHPAIRRAAAHDTEGFFETEIEFRRAFFYPPFSQMAAILV
ncbi:MAG TPA: primosomal protein N', partial [Thermoanaerobaculia bacterium]